MEVIELPSLENIKLPEKIKATSSQCCTPKVTTSVCCKPAENDDLCCPQPEDGSACCQK